MAKKDHDIQPKKEPEEAAIICSVCGQPGNLTEKAGAARWHKSCEGDRPDVIAKVKARA